MAAREAYPPHRLTNPTLNALAEGIEKNREDHQRRKLDREASHAKAEAERKGHMERALKTGVRRQPGQQRQLFE